MSDPSITEPEGREMLAAVCEKDFWNVLTNTIPYWEEMNDNQRSALTSFGYNLGAHFYRFSWFQHLLALALGITPMGRSPRSVHALPSTQAQRLKQEKLRRRRVKQKDVFGLHSRGYGRTRH